jgi:DMSO/TMAO reductase YedYZ molybdopterin-dependent catalytic subunit
MTSVKWLSRISLVDEPFTGYQMRHSYRVRLEESEVGEPITTIAPRSLMSPPGIPEYMSRARTVEAGPCELTGRAWSGRSAIAAVEVSTDGGATWSPAELGDAALGRWAWRAWRYVWDAEPGEYELCCRARNEAGDEQPLTPPWNVGGYVNNAVQRVAVTVV